MNQKVKDNIARHLRYELMKTRSSLNISQAEMASRIGITARGYRSLEAGDSCCALTTVLFFWRKCCVNKVEFIQGLEELIDSIQMEELSD